MSAVNLIFSNPPATNNNLIFGADSSTIIGAYWLDTFNIVSNFKSSAYYNFDVSYNIANFLSNSYFISIYNLLSGSGLSYNDNTRLLFYYDSSDVVDIDNLIDYYIVVSYKDNIFPYASLFELEFSFNLKDYLLFSVGFLPEYSYSKSASVNQVLPTLTSGLSVVTLYLPIINDNIVLDIIVDVWQHLHDTLSDYILLYNDVISSKHFIFINELPFYVNSNFSFLTISQLHNSYILHDLINATEFAVLRNVLSSITSLSDVECLSTLHDSYLLYSEFRANQINNDSLVDIFDLEDFLNFDILYNQLKLSAFYMYLNFNMPDRFSFIETNIFKDSDEIFAVNDGLYEVDNSNTLDNVVTLNLACLGNPKLKRLDKIYTNLTPSSAKLYTGNSVYNLDIKPTYVTVPKGIRQHNYKLALTGMDNVEFIDLGIFIEQRTKK